ncbi:hypothetical protein WPG_0512 [Winogradskyella sp. PG-2]|nr:hypothetical protein WPG_0512 [Winogradskyella sp. PG-2]
MDAQNLPATSIISESGFIADKDTSEDMITGTVLLSNYWVLDAIVHTVDSKTYLPKAINFNVELKTFVVKVAEDSLFTLDKTKVKSIEFNSKSFEILNDKYYENVSKGKLNVYKEYFLSLIKGAIDPISKSKISEDKYVIKSKYFLNDNDALKEIRISKKNILKLIAKEKVNDVKKFMKENKLSVKEDKDLRKIMAYYNSL